MGHTIQLLLRYNIPRAVQQSQAKLHIQRYASQNLISFHDRQLTKSNWHFAISKNCLYFEPISYSRPQQSKQTPLLSCWPEGPSRMLRNTIHDISLLQSTLNGKIQCCFRCTHWPSNVVLVGLELGFRNLLWISIKVVLYEHDEIFSMENPLYMQTGNINFINWTFNFSVTLDGIYDIILTNQQWHF